MIPTQAKVFGFACQCVKRYPGVAWPRKVAGAAHGEEMVGAEKASEVQLLARLLQAELAGGQERATSARVSISASVCGLVSSGQSCQ